MEPLFVYTTFPNKTVAMESAEEVLLKGYAACSNLIENITSSFVWKGKIQTEKEVIVVFKTTTDKYKLLETNLKSSHPYEAPCIVALPLADGNKDFITWIQENTSKKN